MSSVAATAKSNWLDKLGAEPTIGFFVRWLPRLLHGFRLWGAVCLALYIAYWLELENPYWAGMSAAIVCQPSLGASLRKSSFRLVGTFTGAAFPVLLGAVSPQNEIGFMAGLALWGGACAFAATVLRDYAAYAAALAGATTSIVAASALGYTGGIGSDIFMIAVLRASEISVGVVSAGLVVGATTITSARRTLIAEFSRVTAEVGNGLAAACLKTGIAQSGSRPLRHALVSRIVATSPLIENAIGEEYDLQHNHPVLRGATTGLVIAMSGWRTVANYLEQMPAADGEREGAIVHQLLPANLEVEPKTLAWDIWRSRVPALRQATLQAARGLADLPAETPSLRLMADGAAETLTGLGQALDCIAWLDDPRFYAPEPQRPIRYIPDLLPGTLSALRAAATIAAAELLWVVTAWPSGTTAIALAAMSVILFSPRGDTAYAGARDFMLGSASGIALALALKFGVLPACTTTEAVGIALALVLVPIGVGTTVSSVAPLFNAASVLFIRVLSPDNQMNYDAISSWNSALAIMAGLIFAAVAMVLLPAVPPAARARRAVQAALRDLRRLIIDPKTLALAAWEHRNYLRLANLPSGIDPGLLARYVATLSLGAAVLRLRRISERSGFRNELEQALRLLASGRRKDAVDGLFELSRRLADTSRPVVEQQETLRAIGNIQLVYATLDQYADHFDQMYSA